MMSGKVPFLVWMGPVWQPVYLPFVVPLVPLCNPPCTHVDADQELPPRVVRLHVRDGGGGITHGGARGWGTGKGDG
jgi:hypothetical protein